MKKKQISFCTASLAATLLLLLPIALDAQAVPARVDAAIRRVFGEEAQGQLVSVPLDGTQLAAIRSASGAGYAAKVDYYAISVGGRRVGYGLVDDVKGKAKMITYVLLVDASLTVRDLEVLAYREPYGGEVQYEAFRRQFRGKSSRDQLRVGNDIRNISGATISTNAVSNGVRKLLAVLGELKSSGKLR